MKNLNLRILEADFVRYRRFKFRYKETIVTILAEEERYYDVAVEAIIEARKEIEEAIKMDPQFQITLEPMDCDGNVIGRMCRASKLANVGPMATVAGVIAQYAVERMVESGANFAVVDNGGDIAMFLDRPVTVGIFTYDLTLGMRIEHEGFYAVCTSSGTIGHSISFGFADASTIFAEDACVADAFATALGNMIREDFGKEEIERVLESFYAKAKRWVDGALVIKGKVIGMVGRIPKLVKADVKPELITRG